MTDAHPTLRFRDLKGFRRNDQIFDRSIHYTYNGRGAIHQFLRSVADDQRKVVLLPAFHCPSLVDPAIQAGFAVDFYEIDRRLRINRDALLSRLNHDVAVLVVINYFGFLENIDDIQKRCHEIGCILLEDCCHSFLYADPCRLAGDRGDAAVFSFWKTVPSYVGGGIRLNAADLRFMPQGGKVPIRNSIVRGKRMLEQAINNGRDGFLKSAFNYLESKRVGHKPAVAIEEPSERLPADIAYPVRPQFLSTRMPWSAKWILHVADLEAIVQARRTNFLKIHENLHETERLRRIFPSLPDGVCPWAYPVILTGRSEVDYRLRGMGIPLFTFGEVLHPALYTGGRFNDRMVDPSEFLSQNLLCFSVHQNLTHGQVLEFCEKINRFVQQVS